MERTRKPSAENQLPVDTTQSGLMPRVQPPPDRADSLPSPPAEIEIEAERARRLAAERELESQSRWLATVSHEMRSTLTAILVWSDVVTDSGSASPRVAHGLDAIAHNARRHLRLVEDMLDFGTSRAGRLRLRRELLDLCAVVARAVESITPSVEKRRVALKTSFPGNVVSLAGDAYRLEQVLLNVLWNALNNTPAGGTIHVELSAAGASHHHAVRVTDTGAGIASALLASVFDPFRGQAAKPGTAARGAGLGLTVAKEIVERHGGEIEIASEGEGRGTTVVVKLPAKYAS
jgi:signal transduction histidine kinase